MTILKKIAAATTTALVIGTLSVGAFAATEDARSTNGYARFDDYRLSDRGGSQETDLIQKTDNLDYAVVYLEEGGVSSTSPVYFCVYDDSGNIVTETHSPASELGRYELTYKSGKGIKWDYYKLHLNAGYYGLTVSGRWAP